MKLEEIISNLEKKSEVQAVFVTGSQGMGKQDNFSDIDLCVVLREHRELQGVFQWIDGKPCDVYFFDEPALKEILSKQHISPNDKEGLVIGFLENADIKFDKSGLVTSSLKKIDELRNKLLVPESKKKWFERILNSAYITNNRYFESGRSDYLEALEVKMLSDMDMILKAYFEFRNIPWRGERRVLEYLKRNDKQFYNLFMLCLHEPVVKRKFLAYRDLLKSVFSGEYGLWDKKEVHAFPDQDDIKYWVNLII